MKALMVMLLAGFLAGAMSACGEDLSAQNSAKTVARTQVEHGKYVVMMGSCNDCHTIGFAESNGQNPAESEWLTGSPVGFRGPWGTSYPANLRLTVNSMTEDAWVQMCKTRQGLPPMPWPALNNMDESDLRAVYNYIKSLGVKGEKAPAAVAPDQEPQTPYIVFEPQHMERLGNLAK